VAPEGHRRTVHRFPGDGALKAFPFVHFAPYTTLYLLANL
jgi:hypothetical protein